MLVSSVQFVFGWSEFFKNDIFIMLDYMNRFSQVFRKWSKIDCFPSPFPLSVTIMERSEICSKSSFWQRAPEIWQSIARGWLQELWSDWLRFMRSNQPLEGIQDILSPMSERDTILWYVRMVYHCQRRPPDVCNRRAQASGMISNRLDHVEFYNISIYMLCEPINKTNDHKLQKIAWTGWGPFRPPFLPSCKPHTLSNQPQPKPKSTFHHNFVAVVIWQMSNSNSPHTNDSRACFTV